MGRPKKVKPEETIVTNTEWEPRTNILYDPKFGYPRPVPKPSQTKKGKKEESEK